MLGVAAERSRGIATFVCEAGALSQGQEQISQQAQHFRRVRYRLQGTRFRKVQSRFGGRPSEGQVRFRGRRCAFARSGTDCKARAEPSDQ